MGTFTKNGRELHYDGRVAYLAGVHAGVGDMSTTDALNPPFEEKCTPTAMNTSSATAIPY